MSENRPFQFEPIVARAKSKWDGGWCHFCRQEHISRGDDIVLAKRPKAPKPKWGSLECYVALRENYYFKTYFMATPIDPEVVKIGRSVQPHYRTMMLKGLLVAYLDCDVEWELQQRFTDQRLDRREGERLSWQGAGEWFRVNSEILFLVRDADVVFPENDIHGWLEMVP